MAKVRKNIQLEGTIDGINYYRQKGVKELIARKSGGGFNGEAIKTKANMEPVRQTGSEFGRVSRFVKLFKEGLAPLLPENKITDFHSRLMGLFMAIKASDVTSERGCRTVETGLLTEHGYSTLLGYSVFDSKALMKDFYRIVAFDASKSVVVCSRIGQARLVFPKGATMVRFQAALLTVDFDQEFTALSLSESVLFSKQMLSSFELGIPDTGVAERGLRFVLFLVSFMEPNGTDYRRIPGKNGYYLEVVGCRL
ncbi:MAG TPA: hypothetical protein PLC36_10270 [Flavobacterium sp.]|nr:hypothetical protein [Flavobacterium sp.]HQX04369.1 hypothetical protein [Flavobacterium sp.]